MSFANQVAVVTGASSGIGRALVRRLAGEGAKVGVVARRRELLESLSEEVRSAGGTILTAVADVGDREQMLKAFAALAEALGPVDLLVANAGVGGGTRYDPLDVAAIERMYRVNVLGVVYAIEAVLPEMLRRGRGHLAAVSSLAAYKGLPGSQGYTSTKAALNNFMDGLRIHLRMKGTGIAVTTICPGFVRTDMTAKHPFRMPFLLEPDDAARRILRALRRRVAVYNFPWPMALLMGLVTWTPDWLLGYLMRDYENLE
jgi:short-subunit dehydrogenase